MPFLFKFFLILAAITTAGYGKNISYREEGERLIIFQAIEIDTIYHEKGIPQEAIIRANKEGSADYLVFTKKIGDVFGLTRKTETEKIKAVKIKGEIRATVKQKNIATSGEISYASLMVFVLVSLASIIFGFSLVKTLPRKSEASALSTAKALALSTTIGSLIFAWLYITMGMADCENYQDITPLFSIFITCSLFFTILTTLSFFYFKRGKKEES